MKYSLAILGTLVVGISSGMAHAAGAQSCADVFASGKSSQSTNSFDAPAALRKVTEELADATHPQEKAEILAKALDSTPMYTSEAQIFQLWSTVIETASQTRLRDELIGELQLKLAQHLEILPVEKRASGANFLLRDWQPQSGGKSKKPVLTEGMIDARIQAVNVLAQVKAETSKAFFDRAILRDPKNTDETLLYGVEGMVKAIYKFWPRNSSGRFEGRIQPLVNEVHSSSIAALRGGDLMRYLDVQKRLEEALERQAD